MSLEASDSGAFEAFWPETRPATKRIKTAKITERKKTILFMNAPPKFQIQQRIKRRVEWNDTPAPIPLSVDARPLNATSIIARRYQRRHGRRNCILKSNRLSSQGRHLRFNLFR